MFQLVQNFTIKSTLYFVFLNQNVILNVFLPCRELQEGTLKDNGLMDESKIILIPNVETGLLVRMFCKSLFNKIVISKIFTGSATRKHSHASTRISK